MLDPAINDWLQQAIAGTNSGQISWRLVNPTTYTWETSPPPSRVVLQRVERQENVNVMVGGRVQKKVSSAFLLQAFDLSKPQIPQVTLNGSDDSITNNALKELFDAVEIVANRERINFLKSLLPKVTEP